MNFSHEQLVKVAPFSLEDMKQITNCRRDHNRLGFGYQLVFVRLTNRFPAQQPFEVLEDILTNVSIQLGIPVDLIHLYTRRWQTIQQHKERICNYLGLKRFGEEVLPLVKQFIFEEACHLERVSVLLARTELFLREHGILSPAEYTLRRLIANQREEARKYIFKKISASLSKEMAEKLDALLDTKEKKYSDLHFLKQSPGRSSPIAMLKLVQKLEQIQTTGILEIDIAWLNNNLQRIFTRHAQKYSSAKLRGFQAEHRYTALVCFLWQMYQDTVDQIIIMYDRLFNRLYNRAQADIDDHLKSKRKKTKKIFLHYKTLIDVIVEESVNGSIPLQKVYNQIDKEELLAERGE
ncbi:DUF4158 domain-containing protein, partial [Candidatus Saccharibacteria bacterium]|nr:DUF4158 domain-containing protein [Candidatus Saccharibacteria bacterium]NIV04574.1 DUF4158 domain-containing protein [Calditrichia bacterium]NIV73175.1 DUF4158 domain-containing protein [Calditrichia bacterium]NIW00529.1 DUF4158 domain-containing protein [Candidatus Saccharibacteria bacterium]NIW80369.1 DUF4158 domain-containing protein [Calditrichia bacterium]